MSMGGPMQTMPHMGGMPEQQPGQPDQQAMAQSGAAFRINSANVLKLMYGRTISSISSGIAAGVLGLTGIQGILFYFLSCLMVTGALVAKTKAKPQLYLTNSWKATILDGVFDRTMILPYLLFWTFAYALCHIY
eukprot:CAMPEP_0184739796 /NCGR_PEP_ID=MMETSP0315-20130426/2733_1 /TAXON_ID=101924 /ORGANISM="Rhodosorus marinus, Strain UTEX LB 2760" /LENGTH=133 /DNA_ID=CAMNT_0027208961 /DNA_START=262 /DNA_END=663 /DNA_ORIENTATION=+